MVSRRAPTRAIRPPRWRSWRLAIVGALALGFVAVTGALAGNGRTALPSVFDGDPIDPTTRLPYEILPGQPLVTAGADGRLGSADDVVDTSVVGDIDLVVRLGDVASAVGIPEPSTRRHAFVATAGLRGVGTPLPFHVYVSDGQVSPDQPYGQLIPAADLEGLPVIVQVFADRDGDGMIGPFGSDPARQVRQLEELEPVGREVAFFSGGIASGSVMMTAGGPSSRGGLNVVATAMALTGTYDPAFLGGFVPNGRGVTTAQPFLPERDPAILFRSADMAPAAVDYPLNPAPRAAGLPGSQTGLSLALPTDGSSPTVDIARSVAGPAVCARLREPSRIRRNGIAPEPSSLVVGTLGKAGRVKLRLVAVDRLGNPTDPDAEFTASVTVDGPLLIPGMIGNGGASQTKTVVVRRARRASITLRSSAVGHGVIKVSIDGVVCQRIPYESRSERNPGAADAVVAASGAEFSTIGAALAAATDRNNDGLVTIEVGEGIFPETVRLDRPVDVRGAGAGRTVIDGRGLGPALAIADPGARVRGLSARGGTSGVDVETWAAVSELEAQGNIGAGIRLLAAPASIAACVARQNGGDGFAIEQPATVARSLSIDNGGAGIAVYQAAGAAVLDNRVTANGGSGITVMDAAEPTITGNTAAGNLGAGITLGQTSGGLLYDNRAGANEGDGLRLTASQGVLIDANDLTANDGFGLSINQSSADFSILPGTQAPIGTNDVSDNGEGSIEIN